MTDGNGWDEYKRMVITDLERLESKLDKLDEKFDGFAIEFGKLKTEFKIKASVIGAVAGLVGAGVVAFVARILG